MISHSSHRFFLSVLSLAAGLAPSGCLSEVPDDLAQEDEQTGQASQEIKNPTTVASAYPEAVLLNGRKQTDPENIFRACSGSVIAPRVVLTAGHCVLGKSEWQVTAPHAGNQTAASVKGIRFDYTDLSASRNPNQHDIGLVFLDKDIVLPYPIIANTSTGSNILNIGRTNNGAISSTSLFVSQPVAIGASVGFPFHYVSNASIIETGDMGGPDVLPGPVPHTIVAVNSGVTATSQILARVDLLSGWIQERVAAKSCGPTCPNPLDQSPFFVRQMYLDVLGREPDSGGLTFYQNALNSCNGGTACLASTRIAIARGFLESPENRAQYPELNPASPGYNSNFVKHCYWNFLARQPDTAGFNFWMNALNSSGDYNGVVQGFITSPEFRSRFGAP